MLTARLCMLEWNWLWVLFNYIILSAYKPKKLSYTDLLEMQQRYSCQNFRSASVISGMPDHSFNITVTCKWLELKMVQFFLTNLQIITSSTCATCKITPKMQEALLDRPCSSTNSKVWGPHFHKQFHKTVLKQSKVR